MFETGKGKFELMGVNHSARSGSMIGITFRFSLTYKYVVYSHQNRLIVAILMSTQNIPFP